MHRLRVARRISSVGLFAFGLKKVTEDKPVIQIERCIRSAKIEEMESADSARRTYHECLEKTFKFRAKLNEWEFKQSYAYILSGLANLEMDRGNWKHAELLFVDFMRICKDLGKPDHSEEIISASLKLSTIYANNDQYEKAEIGFEFAIAMSRLGMKSQDVVDANKPAEYAYGRRKELIATDVTAEEFLKEEHQQRIDNYTALLGVSLDNYGRYLMSQKRFPDAVRTLREASSVAVGVFGEDDSETLRVKSDLSVVLVELNEFDEAIKILRQVSSSAALRDLPETGQYLYNLGEVCLQAGKVKDAVECCEKSLNRALKDDDKELSQRARACLRDARNRKT